MADDLKAMPEAEFKELEFAVNTEAARRKHEARTAKLARHDAHCDGLKTVLIKPLLDVLMPNHDGKGCSDDNRHRLNFQSNDWNNMRCTRCVLLELMHNPRMLREDLWVRLIVHNQE